MNQPKTLDEAVDMFIKEIEDQKATDFVKKEGIPHHGAGTSIRNNLRLWWQPDWSHEIVNEKGEIETIPTPKPELVQWFNDRNIYHADDMFGTISAAIQAKLNGEEFDLDEHLKRYFKHWKKYGFKDGVFKNK